ncbi:vesicle-associated protein 1-3-like [Coffea eugenioides]|uniref:Vesicle-associated protein 1-3-like isoform X1 n=1 Tax=Coffea arabica TaxID=13443 RepID=A0A6P6WCL4_COFAR|nr:vesicle-associated protein 1-3-like [Coffea arabica]XP_027155893.1 vesicle-associated protein 1-3-like [Coffea eugenioides]XP_027161074.1 vesicle-associated protein 1-3-like [Coffea eugenioides]
MGISGPGDFLSIHPTELKFPFELRKQSSCSLQLINRTDQYIAFKVKTTNPRKYSVRPNAGVIRPGAISNVTVTMQAHKEMPPDMQCKDKFLVQSVVMPEGAKELNQQMFEKEDGKVIGESKLRVAYIPANPPSPVPEEPEEDSSPISSMVDDEVKSSEHVSRTFEESTGGASSSEDWPMISKLMEEKTSATQQNQKLYLELEKTRKEILRNQVGRVSLFIVLLIGLVGVLIGYFIR